MRPGPEYLPFRVRVLTSTWLAYAGFYFCRKAFYVVKSDVGESLGLVVIGGPRDVAVHLLQAGHVGVQSAQHLDDAIQPVGAVRADALVDVPGDDA